MKSLTTALCIGGFLWASVQATTIKVVPGGEPLSLHGVDAGEVIATNNLTHKVQKTHPMVLCDRGLYGKMTTVRSMTVRLNKAQPDIPPECVLTLYWLPKKIAERPRAEAPGPRRDEGVDEHPRPRNNAGTGVSAPELDFFFTRVAARIPNPNYPVSAIIFGNQYMEYHRLHVLTFQDPS